MVMDAKSLSGNCMWDCMFSQHEADRSEAEEGERFVVEALPVLGHSSAATKPGKSAFDDPAPGKDDEVLA
jgi:hypothetical protein